MATYNKFQMFVQNIANGKMNLGTDVLKVMLTNTLPVATNQVFADITEITAQNGYSAGGATSTQTGSSQTGGIYKLVSGNVTFTATPGGFGPFRYAVLYDSTPSSPLKPLISWYDNGSSISLNNGDTFTVSFDQTNGVLQIV